MTESWEEAADIYLDLIQEREELSRKERELAMAQERLKKKILEREEIMRQAVGLNKKLVVLRSSKRDRDVVVEFDPNGPSKVKIAEVR